MRDLRLQGLLAVLLVFWSVVPHAHADTFVANRGVTTNCADDAPPPPGGSCAGGITAGVPYTIRVSGIDVATGPQVNASFEAEELDFLTIVLDVSSEPDGCTFVSDIWVYPGDGGCRFLAVEQGNYCGTDPLVVGGLIPDFPDACSEPGFQAAILDVPTSAEVGEIVTANLSLTSLFSPDDAETLFGCSLRSMRATDVNTAKTLFGLSNEEPLNCISGFSWTLPPDDTIMFPYAGVPQRPGTGTVAFRDSFFGLFGEFGSDIQAYPIPQPESGEIEVTGGLTLKLGLPAAVPPENVDFDLIAEVTNNGSTTATIDPIVCDDFVADVECADVDESTIACDPNAPHPDCCDPDTDPECCDPFEDEFACECDDFSILGFTGPASPSGSVDLAPGATRIYTCPFQTLGEKGRGFFEPNVWEWTHESGGRVELDFECPGLHGNCNPAEDHLILEVTDQKPPTAAFVWSIDTNDPNRRIFNAAPSDDEDGEIVLYEWDLAGTPAQGLITSKSFAPGTHTIVLTVTDNDGFMNTVSEDIVIADPSPGTWKIPLGEIGDAIAAITAPADDPADAAIFSTAFDGTEKELDLSVIAEAAATANCGTGPPAADRLLDELKAEVESLESRIPDLIQTALESGFPAPAPGTTQTIDLPRGQLRSLTRKVDSLMKNFGNVAQAGRLVRQLLGSEEGQAVLEPMTAPPDAGTSPFQMDLSEIVDGLTAHFDADGNVNGLSGGTFTGSLCGAFDKICSTPEFPAVQFTTIRDSMKAVKRLLGDSPNPDLQLPTTRWSERQAERLAESLSDAMDWEGQMVRAARGALRAIIRSREGEPLPRVGITNLVLQPRHARTLQRALLRDQPTLTTVARFTSKTLELQTTAIDNLR